MAQAHGDRYAAPRLLAVVPVRMAATRLPGKPLLQLAGRSVVQWVYDATTESGVFDRVVVATDSDEIAATAAGFGAEVVLTGPDLMTGSERVAAASAVLGDSAEVVANVQGDQPFVTREMLEALVTPYLDGRSPDMTTIGSPLASPDQANDSNVAKVVRDRSGRALYFSRSPIPWGGVIEPEVVLHHLGLYAFRADFLATYAGLPPSRLEEVERLEQLRVLDHGYEIVVTPVDRAVLEINTPDDYRRAQQLVETGVGA